MQAAVSVKALEKQLQQKKDTDPIMAGIKEEVRHYPVNTSTYYIRTRFSYILLMKM